MKAFGDQAGSLENCGKRFINFENPTPKKIEITFNKTRPYRVSHLQISDTSRQMDILYEPFQTFSAFPYMPPTLATAINMVCECRYLD